ncbi:hypothetical protein ACIB24_06125 [Spongisporangium articulatum]|uniref:DUF3592 domain-containing protein n=1 Tax=Spongisporangium articulatum TaxID=3362603 RepID=A0ABW8AJV8_9ACTN
MRLRSVRGRFRRWPPTTGVGWARLALFLVVIPAVCLYVLAGAPSAYRAASAAYHGEGTPGLFTATTKQCGRYGCRLSGDFAADGGTARRQDVEFNGRVDVGDTVPALLEANGEVYAPDDRGELTSVMLRSALSVLYLLGALGWVTVALLPRRRRAERSAP